MAERKTQNKKAKSIFFVIFPFFFKIDGSPLQKFAQVLKRVLSPCYCGYCGISHQGPTNLASNAGFPKFPHSHACWYSFMLILLICLHEMFVDHHETLFSLCIESFAFVPAHTSEALCLGSGLRTSNHHFQDKKIVKSLLSLLSLLQLLVLTAKI